MPTLDFVTLFPLRQTCVTGHECNLRCYGNTHTDVGYDSRLGIMDTLASIKYLQELHDRLCPFTQSHYLTVLSMSKVTEALTMEERYPEEKEVVGYESTPFLFTFQWGLLPHED